MIPTDPADAILEEEEIEFSKNPKGGDRGIREDVLEHEDVSNIAKAADSIHVAHFPVRDYGHGGERWHVPEENNLSGYNLLEADCISNSKRLCKYGESKENESGPVHGAH